MRWLHSWLSGTTYSFDYPGGCAHIERGNSTTTWRKASTVPRFGVGSD